MIEIKTGLKLKYNGFGSNVGNIYEVVKVNGRNAILKGKVYKQVTTFPIALTDLKAAIVTGDYNPVLKENSTHEAIAEKGKISIYIKGFEIEGTVYKPEYLYSIPLENEDDLLAIFDRLDEDNRVNVAEANEALKG